MPGFVINAGHWVDVDSAAKTAFLNGDTTQSVLSQIDWSNPISPARSRPPPATAQLTLSGTSTSGVTQVQAIWNDGYLT